MKFADSLSRWIKNFLISRAELSELSRLIEQRSMVVLKPCLNMKENQTARRIVHEVVKEYLEVYRSIWLRRETADRLELPRGAVLLRYPLALLSTPTTHEDYIKSVGGDTRRKIRKAEKEGYEFGEFEWNDYLDDIFEINTSKDVRSGGPMIGWYREPVKPRNLSGEERYYQKYYGVFKDGHLWAYLCLVLCGDFGVFKHILGHAAHLKNGVMYYLVSSAVRDYVGHPHVKWFSYGIFAAGEMGGTIDFRRHARFESYAAFLDLADEQELLKYS